ncbi:MAG: RNA-directed DNA polymerase [Gammaproteobacteria bacterium]|nr:RNA-directed DNA polymerase [Gammaproteobacteria bacterium]
MTRLTEDSLEFARIHIAKYYDSDFFPRQFEFEALSHSWDEVKHYLSASNVSKLHVSSPLTVPAPKPSGTYRVVHQLEPLEALTYTALAYQVAPSIERARCPVDQKIACSYRFDVRDGNFFSAGTGYSDFFQKTEDLSDEYTYVLTTDITDFYNQIYLHRLNNAIEFSDENLKSVSDDIEVFLGALNNKSSQGVPVGPAASIIMSEAVLLDIDNCIVGKGVPHTRYVDDFRIFSNSKIELQHILQELTVYLYKHHRLTLASHKTAILESDRFVADRLHNAYAEEKIEILQTLEVFNPYTEEIEEIEIELDEIELLEAALANGFEKLVDREELDLGLARTLLRKAKRQETPIFIEALLDNFEFFSPAINDVCLYLSTVLTDDLINDLSSKFIAVTSSAPYRNSLVRLWMDWLFSSKESFLDIREIYESVRQNQHLEIQARAAIIKRDLPWAREKKDELYRASSSERRAIIRASQILPSDERRHWLRLTQNGPWPIDSWVAKWVLDVF